MKINTIMRSKFLLINAGLALAAGFFLTKTVQVWQGPGLPIPGPASVAKSVPDDDSAKQPGTFSPNRAASKSSYRGITDKNLFAADRKEYQPEAEEAETVVADTVKVDGRKITLFGVMAIGGHPSALISNPDPTAEGRKSLWVTTGDRVGNLTVAAISDQAITFDDGKKKYRVDLYEQKRRRQTHTVSKQDAPVVVQTQVIKPTPAKKSTTAVDAAGKDGDDEYEIVNTPFGKTRRKKKKP
jgi:hypothetical protein